MSSEKLSPMYEQYLNIKKDYPNAFLFYRMGDFYELFFEDAVIVAKELQLTLTSRNKDSGIPMCGVPHHALEPYAAQLIEKGYSLVICDQIENPKDAKGLVKRAVTRMITPGTILESGNLNAKEHNFLGAFFQNTQSNLTAFAWLDISTGDWTGIESPKAHEVIQWVLKINPRELLIADNMPLPSLLQACDSIQKTYLPQRSHFDKNKALDSLKRAQQVQDAASLGLENKTELTCCCGALVIYLEQTQKQDVYYLKPFQPLNPKKYLIIDEITEKNLEFFQRTDGKKGIGTLFYTIDNTLTPQGGRLLAERLKQPFAEKEPIEHQLETVSFFVNNSHVRSALRVALETVYDIERLSTKLHLNRALPKDCIALRNALQTLPTVYEALFKQDEKAIFTRELKTEADIKGREFPPLLQHIIKSWDNITDLTQVLTTALADTPASTLTEGEIFKHGYNAELDVLLELIEHGENLLQKELESEQGKNALPKLKLGYNRVFGYYFELSKGAIPQTLPQHFQTRQTLATGERYTTTELKILEEKILSASDTRKTLEYKLFQKLREKICSARQRLIFMADLLAQLDCSQGLAETASKHNWVCPVINENTNLDIREGRHPVVEALLGSTSFVPNSLKFDNTKRLLLITGPNMAGKSTVLRQTALIVLLAQMGSYVPAQAASVGITDRIFSRVGASDNLARGQSTFMVEMMETARILRQSTKKSLIILDEIGRGTSTYDGLSLAWAIVEELTKRPAASARTLFATHYHELTALEGNREGVYTMTVAIREWQGEIVFLRKLIPGPSDKSYGIDVAKLAGIPASVVQRAKAILTHLEQYKTDNNTTFIPALLNKSIQLTLPDIELPVQKPKNEEFVMPIAKAQEVPLIEILQDLNPEDLTPIQALNLITEWKKLWGQKQS